MAAIADEIDHDVALEAPSEGERETDRRDRRFRIVSVDVDDRDVEAFGEVAGVARRPSFAGVGRETHLVVCNQVKRAARRIALERGEVQRLRDAPLAGEGRVSMNQHREGDVRIVQAEARRAISLLGPSASFDDRVHRLEMARVRGEGDRDLPGRRRARRRRAQVVLHVTGSALVGRDDRVDRPLALELAEDRVVPEPERVRENVEPAAVSHPDHDLVRAVLRR